MRRGDRTQRERQICRRRLERVERHREKGCGKVVRRRGITAARTHLGGAGMRVQGGPGGSHEPSQVCGRQMGTFLVNAAIWVDAGILGILGEHGNSCLTW
eukprot:356113-Chlamydomonas_euryale.AAC.2